jgi:chaperonin GroES
MEKERKSMNARPMYDRVIIRPIKEEPVTESGFVLAPAATQENPTKGEVLATGAGFRTETGNIIPLMVKPGDTVMFAQYAGQPIKVSGEELLIMKEEDIYGILDDE